MRQEIVETLKHLNKNVKGLCRFIMENQIPLLHVMVEIEISFAHEAENRHFSQAPSHPDNLIFPSLDFRSEGPVWVIGIPGPSRGHAGPVTDQ
ncbi:hypothetical protein [Pseudomonas hunanensis]|uniref:hypothetical protein n=1 Tax=Pseudomonas hunanensis TaxID=1247546 RepID=UPI00142D1DFE|nr:hypothetical protein [Pseudomonas hunanensis]